MSSLNDKKNESSYQVPRAPKPINNIIPKVPSYINLMEVDDDSDSDNEQYPKLLDNKNKYEKQANDGYISDDRYDDEDEFKETDFNLEIKPNSGNLKNDEN